MKKVLSILIIACLILASAVPAFASDTVSGKGLEKAILQVKSVTTIPSDYKNFQYSSNIQEENGVNVSTWYLNWTNADSSSGISATCVDGGYLINFSTYSSKQPEGLGSISRDDGKKVADAFLAKARPDIASSLKLQDNSSYTNSDSQEYRYKPSFNGVLVNYIDVMVDVDKHTGLVTNYNYNGDSEEIKGLPATDGVIGLAAAEKAYLDKIHVSLSYYSNYDYNKKTLTVFPAYTGSNNQGKAIDAKTGNVVDLFVDNGFYGGKGDGAAVNQASETKAADGELTKEEMDAISNISNLIPKDKAVSILRSAIPNLAADAKVVSSSLSKSYVEQDKYQWEIGFDGAYGVVNAKTGEVTSFYIYNDDSGKGSANLTEEKARAKADAFINQMEPDKFKQSRFYESPQIRIYKMSDTVTDYSFNYYRQVNGVDFVGNGFTVIVNKATGNVTQYDCTWYDNVTFPDISKVMTQEAAFKILNEAGKMDLVYEKVNKGEPGLVYDFTNSTGNFLIDPVSGAKIGWDGKPYKEQNLPEYSDIKGHWAEAKILKLLDNGYYLEGDQFKPNQKITQLGFLRYLYSPIQMYYDNDEFYKMMINDKIIKENEKAPNAVMTRQDAAKFVVRYLGQGKAAEHPEIFINPFKDKIADSYKGYAAICYGMKVMQGDKEGRFNGLNQVTNAEAAVIIYNVLQVK